MLTKLVEKQTPESMCQHLADVMPGLLKVIYIIKQDIRIYMSPIAGQTAGPNGLKFFCGHSGVPGCVSG